jgi:hypothetical protein
VPYCPNCKTEYEEGVVSCAKCGSALIEARPDEAEEQEFDDVPEFLTTVDNSVLSDMLEARLKSAGIPCYIKPHEKISMPRLFLGSAVIAADFYVPSKLLEKAKMTLDIESEEPLDGETWTDEDAGEADEGTGEVEEPGTADSESAAAAADGYPANNHEIPEKWTKKYLRRRIIAFVVLLLVLAAYFSFDALLDFIRKLFGY